MNRRKHTAARQSLRRIATASAIAGALTLAAVAWTACASASAKWEDEATAAAVGYILHGGPLTFGELHHAPADLANQAWQVASARNYTPRPDPATAAASARVLDFATGRADTVDEADLMNASPAAIRAAVDSGRLD
jgi:hypothetical protein